MSTVEDIIWSTLRAAGGSATSVAGILGNMAAESGVRADIDEYGGGGGYGLVQWTPKSKLVDWAVSRGLDPASVSTQCQRIIWEVDNGQQFYKAGTTFHDWFISDTTPEAKADDFVRYYERPAVVNSQTRQAAARDYFNMYAGTPIQTGPTYYDGTHVTGVRDTGKLQELLGVTVDHVFGPNSVRAFCAWAGYNDDVISGQSVNVEKWWPQLTSVWIGGTGSPTIAKLQRLIGAADDGLWGPNTADALEQWFDKGCPGW